MARVFAAWQTSLELQLRYVCVGFMRGGYSCGQPKVVVVSEAESSELLLLKRF